MRAAVAEQQLVHVVDILGLHLLELPRRGVEKPVDEEKLAIRTAPAWREHREHRCDNHKWDWADFNCTWDGTNLVMPSQGVQRLRATDQK